MEMNFIDQDDRTSKVLVTVDQKKLNSFYSKIPVLSFDESNNALDTERHTEEIDIKLNTRDKIRFDKVFTEILTAPIKGRQLAIEEINQQKNDLLYILSFLKKIDLNSYSKKRTKTDKAKFLKIISLLEAIDDIDQADNLQVLIIKANGRAYPPLEVPKADNAKKLYEYISKSIYDYFSKNPDSVTMELYLNAYKEPVNSALLRRRYNEIKDESKLVEPDHTMWLPVYTSVMLPYLSSLPQFPPSKRANSLFSEAQARFVLAFFQLFGLNNQSNILNLQGHIPAMTEKQLRKKYVEFITKFKR